MCLNETCSKVHVGKYLSDTFPIQNGLKQGDALSPLQLCFAEPKGSINSTQGIRGFISIMATSNDTQFLKRNNVLLKIFAKLL
jgi:hypothetical protein